MELTKRERRRHVLHRIIADAGLSRQQAAVKLGISRHTLDAWLKPATSVSSVPVPGWAIEFAAVSPL
jgi:predicted DNA-binding protein (UPF0251 family)